MYDDEANLPKQVTHEEIRQKNREMNWQSYSDRPLHSPAPATQPLAEEGEAE